jgi:molybdopterin-guanine dinucleotide biosynthesis protein A
VGGKRIVDRIEYAMQGVVDDVLIVRDDILPLNGSLVGIHSALAIANDDALVVAWDMPFVTSQLLFMIKRALTDDAYAAIPVTSRPQPLCAAYSKACLPILEAWLDGGNLRVMDFVDSLPIVNTLTESQLSTAGDPETLFFNANTPQALAIAEEMARGG